MKSSSISLGHRISGMFQSFSLFLPFPAARNSKTCFCFACILTHESFFFFVRVNFRHIADAPLNIVNLIDSPGHVDFSGEVEAALRISDGAILVVDIVEGVCAQTVTVLRAALKYAVRPILVLNKLDRLFSELRLDPMEAYRHIVSVLEQVNVIMGVRQIEEMMAAALDVSDDVSSSDWHFDDPLAGTQDAVSGYFSPELGNVVFASAIDGWAFRVSDFASLFSKRFGLSEKVLTKTLWGEYYLHAKSKRIVRKKAADLSSNAKPMFVQFVLSNLHSVYDTLISTQNDYDLAINKRQNIADKLGLKVTARDLKHRDASTALHAIMNAWLPAASCLMNAVVDKLPNAAEAQGDKERLAVLWPHASRALISTQDEEHSASNNCAQVEFKRQFDALSSASSDKNVPLMVYVAKMIETNDDALNSAQTMNIRTPKRREELEAMMKETENQSKEDTAAESGGGNMIAFARILSGSLSAGDEVYVYAPKYSVSSNGSYDSACVAKGRVSGVYLLMGRGLDPVAVAGAGSLVGVSGLSELVLKTATLSSEPPGTCLPFGCLMGATGLEREAVVRVAVEPHMPNDLEKLQKGLRRLNQADPAVETFISAKGEHIIAAHGELHLERCLIDLRESFAKGIRIHVSKPIVSFRESVCGGVSANVEVSKNENDVESSGAAVAAIEGIIVESSKSASSAWDDTIIKHGRFVRFGNSKLQVRTTAVPLPSGLARTLEEVGGVLDSTQAESESDGRTKWAQEKVMEALKTSVEESITRKQISEKIVAYWKDHIFPRVWASGPKVIGSNILVGLTPGASCTPGVSRVFGAGGDTENTVVREVEKAMIAGFHLGIRCGPLCEEPLYGVGIFIEELKVMGDDGQDAVAEENENVKIEVSGISGMVIGWMKEAVRLCVQHGNARLVEGMLHIDISVPASALGKTHTVIAQRRGRVLKEDVKEGVNEFGIEAYLPVAESFGFTDVLRKYTSGFAMPQMVMSHWEMLDTDPFWFAQTEEELEDVGAADTTAEHNNLARKLMNSVRRRKGLRVEEKIVERAEKQRTLSRKK